MKVFKMNYEGGLRLSVGQCWFLANVHAVQFQRARVYGPNYGGSAPHTFGCFQRIMAEKGRIGPWCRVVLNSLTRRTAKRNFGE